MNLPKSSSRLKPTSALIQIEVNQKVNPLNKRIENVKSAYLGQQISLPQISNNNGRYNKNEEENTYFEKEVQNKLQKVNRSHILQQLVGLKKKQSTINAYPINEQNKEYFNNPGNNKSTINILKNKFRNNGFITNGTNQSQLLKNVNDDDYADNKLQDLKLPLNNRNNYKQNTQNTNILRQLSNKSNEI